jgi:HPt (histidine-containing phosphotransfer) domain-containing protein
MTHAIDRDAFERLREITGEDDVFVAELIDTYLDDGARQVADVVAAAAAGEVEAMVRPAHTLKSASDSIGALRLADHCRVLEAAARTGSVPDPVGSAADVSAAFEEAAAALAALRPAG